MTGTVLVVGASSGIGLAVAARLTVAGYIVHGGVRDERGAQALAGRTGGRARPILFDVSDGTSVVRALHGIESTVGTEGLQGLVYSAGISIGGPLETMRAETLEAQLQVNTIGLLRVLQASLSLLRRGGGRIIHIGSTSTHLPSAMTSGYAASKAAAEALLRGLRVETAGTGLAVSIVDPGVVATPFWQRSATAEQALPPLSHETSLLYGARLRSRRHLLPELARGGMAPEHVAAVVHHALTCRRPRLRYLVGRDAKLRVAAARLLPEAVLVRLAERSWRSTPDAEST